MDKPTLPPEDQLFDEESPKAQVPVSGGLTPDPEASPSPRWNATTKLVIGLLLAAICAFLLLRFMNFIGPLLLAFMLAYLFYPIAGRMRNVLHLPWRLAVTIIYIAMVVLVVGSIALGGLALVEQVKSLIDFLTSAVKGLPAFITDIVSRPIYIGPFSFNPQLLDVNAVVQQILSTVQPILSQAGSSVVTFASGAATAIGWMFFIMLISYFMLAESGGSPNRLINLKIPGHEADMRKLGTQLSRIWNSFLRGQIIIMVMTIAIYNVLLGSLGVHYFFGLSLVAGMARFIPYVGPFVAWTSYGLVSYFQGSTIFGLPPLGYVALVVGISWLMDLFLDNFVVPRLMSSALRVHPAAVMVSALIALNLLGVIGVIMAAPVLATIMLFLDYIFAKLFDEDPWKKLETSPPPSVLPGFIPQLLRRIEELRKWINKFIVQRFKKTRSENPE